MTTDLKAITLLSGALFLAASPALASSEEEWAKFAAAVEDGCTQAASDMFRRPVVAVDPTGSENFGLAIVYGRLKGGGKERATVICVYDKKTGAIELGSGMGTDIIRVRKPKPAANDAAANQPGADQTAADKPARNKAANRKAMQQDNADMSTDDMEDDEDF